MVTIVRESASATGADRVPVYTDNNTVTSTFDSIQASVTANTITTADVDLLIIMAEEIIDNLTGYWKKYHSKFATTDDDFDIQHTTFPRLEDFRLDENDSTVEIPYIPYEIEEATLLIVEALFSRIIDTSAASTTGVPADLQQMLLYGGSVKIHDFSFSVNAQRTLDNASQAGSTAAIKDWVLTQPKGHYIWSLINKFTNFTAKAR